MSDGQKAPFKKKYETEKAKWDKKMAKYKTTKDYANFLKKREQHKLDTVKNSKFKKDVNAPKRPLSAYFLFMEDEREELVADGMTHKEAMGKMGEMWSKLSAAKKKPYQDKAAAAKAKYQKVLEKYKKTNLFKKYQKEKDEFYYNKKLSLKRLEASRSRSKSKKPKAPKRSVSRSKSKKRSARKASKPKAPKRSVSRSKSKARMAKKSKSRARSRSKSKKRSAKKAAKKPEAPKPAAEPAAPAQ